MTVPNTQERKAILSLFDFTGNWSRQYREQGYEVVQIDIQLGTDIMTWDYRSYPRTYFSGILAAIPCSDFALSGSRWFREKDANGNTYESMALVYKTLAIIQWFQPGLRWWLVENPMSRIHILCKDLADIRMSFDPYEFARSDPLQRNSQYQKRPWLWGCFEQPIKTPLPNLDGPKHYLHHGGKSSRTKNVRSSTPLGFAYAFAQANP